MRTLLFASTLMLAVTGVAATMQAQAASYFADQSAVHLSNDASTAAVNATASGGPVGGFNDRN